MTPDTDVQVVDVTTDRRTDGRTDGRTNTQTDGRTDGECNQIENIKMFRTL
jgi:hypothetical protein